MAPRAIWKGQLELGQLVCPVALHAAASTSERVAFHFVNRETGHRLRRVFVDAETGKPVERRDQAKGYENDRGKTIVLEDEELAEAVPDSDKVLRVEAFIPCRDVDTLYLDRPYYMTPDGEAAEAAFAVIRAGLAKRKAAAIARTVLFRSLRPVLIQAQGAGLIASTLEFDHEVRDAGKAFGDIPELKLDPAMLDLARHIIDTNRGKFEPGRFEDRYDDALAALVKARTAKPACRPCSTARSNRSASASISTRMATSCCGTRAGSASKGWSRSNAKHPIRSAAAAAGPLPAAPASFRATNGWRCMSRTIRSIMPTSKAKCSDRQEFVVAGYVPSSVSMDLVGSLVLGYYEDGKLRQAGRVGTGFSREVARSLLTSLKPLSRKTAPFPEKPSADAARGVVWVKPDLVAEVEFRAWTADGILRHAAFRGLREDKPAREIIREADTEKPAPKPKPQVKLTNPDRVYWPDVGVTKQNLADYFAEVWPRMAPFVVNRPVALLRCPGGAEGQCFFQKHAWKGFSLEILTFRDPLDDDENPLVAIDGLPGLIGLVQGGALEIHTWQSTLDDLEHPDQIVMDLDPGEGVPWEAVLDAAREVRARFEAAGLAGFVKTSGGKGLHVVAPLKPTDAAGWDEVKGFAAAMARSMAGDDPDRYVATISKAKRTGRILLDYLRNGRNSTAIVAYGSRARPGAPVSMPLDWNELGPDIGPAQFTVVNAPEHVANVSDPWADFRASAAPLPVEK